MMMCHGDTLVAWSLLLACVPAAGARAGTFAVPQTDRHRIVFNRDWRFSLGDHPGAEVRAYDDASWEPVALPHSFSLPYFRSARFYVGYGWYRKHFQTRPQWRGKRLFLEFEGAFQDAEIFVNGQRVGGHQGGYTGFSIDITNAVKTGDNVVAVRLNNNWNPRLAPRAGEHQFCGGIYRDVYLLVANPLHVTWNGTFVTTPQVSAGSARANVKTEVRNDATRAKRCTVITTIVDPDNQVVAEMRTTRTVPAATAITFDQTSNSIARPKLWHPDHPYLYSVYTTLLDGSKPVDDHISPLGFRWFQWTADRGFFLNGEHYYLRGANVHQDHAGWGIAITQAGVYRDVKLIKDAGFNFIRGSHYPHHPAFAEACDRLGLVFWSENVFWGKGGYGEEGYWNASAYPVHEEDFQPFEESCQQQLREMIRINRNHPSIVIWSMTNEAFFTENVDRAKNLVLSLVRLSHELDPTRPAAVGGAQRRDFDRLGDVAGYNGDGARLFTNPGIPNMVTEYGAVGKGVPGEYDPYFGDLANQPAYPWRSGQAIWCGFDYGTIAGRQAFKGIIDYFRLPKRSWYWYRNQYRNIPPPEWPKPGIPARLQLSADRTVIRNTDGTDDAQVIVLVFDAQDRRISNSPLVTLTIESGPGEFPTGRSITFTPRSEIMVVDGQAAMEFRSYYGGRSLIRATSQGLQDAILTITTEGEPVYVEGKTPRARVRPYVPAGLSGFRPTVEATADVGRDRPARASSEAAGQPARNANDGDANTAWTPTGHDRNTWWLVDLEGLYLISSTRLTFSAAETHRYRIETSEDGEKWETSVDQTELKAAARIRVDTWPAGSIARYVRVTFPGGVEPTVSSLAEVAVLGTLWTQ